MPPVGFEPTISAGVRPQAAHLLKSWVRIPPGAWIFVCCECRVLSGTGLCDELITRAEESYRLCCVVVCDLETTRMGAPYIYDISHVRVKFISVINLYVFRAGLLLIIRRIPILPTASQHKHMTYTNCSIYRVVPPNDEQ